MHHQLKYKAEWRGVHVSKVNRFYPSTKICFECKNANPNLTLKDREWDCPSCGAHLLRDENAANNIEHEGILRLKQKLAARTAESINDRGASASPPMVAVGEIPGDGKEAGRSSPL